MKIEKFVKPKDCEIKYEKYLILLKNFDESCLKVTLYGSGIHDYDNNYVIGYQKFGERDVLPLYFVIPQLYGYVKENDNALHCFDEKYLHVCCDVQNDFKKLLRAIIDQISESRSKKL